jgi:hypothetical protein
MSARKEEKEKWRNKSESDITRTTPVQYNKKTPFRHRPVNGKRCKIQKEIEGDATISGTKTEGMFADAEGYSTGPKRHLA